MGGSRVQLDPDFVEGKRRTAALVLFDLYALGNLLGLVLLFPAEAAVGRALFHQQLGVLSVQLPPLRLDIGSHRAAHVRAFVVAKAALGHCLVDYVGSALYKAALIGVLNAQEEGAPRVAGDEPGVQRGAQVAHVHIAGGGGGETGADLPFGNTGLHFVKECVIYGHEFTSMYCLTIYYRFCSPECQGVSYGERSECGGGRTVPTGAKSPKQIALSNASCYND
ncbi:hypothetical protein SDC9_91109 [bioreactor metagenome]|uniref:Uncharacterized protein n=1 Tax=bioreactor metagenome TaxID=1076179 RepID=A0A644ZWX9_9ZZZZ